MYYFLIYIAWETVQSREHAGLSVPNSRVSTFLSTLEKKHISQWSQILQWYIALWYKDSRVPNGMIIQNIGVGLWLSKNYFCKSDDF